uniref:Cytochrome c biogenesis protein CcsA n=1 Tax=Micractinium pusillum TaxID=126839 RepID=A0A650F1W1_9CHLO|nr:cytochrome c heme attachment protein [Micractinium pusillum]
MIVDIPVVERFCANSCFALLFCTTLYYWSKMIFAGEADYTQTGLLGFGITVFSLTTHLILRWFDSGHFPLSNLYESLLFLSWCLLILHIYIETATKTLFLGVLTSPALLCLIAFTDFSLPPELQRSGPLVPALQSNWLIMHVTVMIASYAALLLGCLVAIAYLIFSQFFENRTGSEFREFSRVSKSAFALDNQVGLNKSNLTKISFISGAFAPDRQSENQDNFGFEANTDERIAPNSVPVSNSGDFPKFLLFLDNLSYRTLGIGFCLLTLGILSGAVWANETWGNYWSWDPKETWAFITWLTFACYLHSRLIGGWTGSKPAWIASFGFIIVWVCYLGVNLLGQGLHSYGFLQL